MVFSSLWKRVFGEPPIKYLLLEGIRIPQAYILLEDWRKQHPGQEVPGKDLRVFLEKYTFIFDQTNVDYLHFVERCKDDTRNLRKAFSKELQSRELPFRGTQVRAGRTRKNETSSVSFLIRPPFFSSYEEKNEDTRWQGKEIVFVLHVDENNFVTGLRYYSKGDVPELTLFKRSMALWVTEHSTDLQYSYRDWPTFSHFLANGLEENMHHLGYEKERAA